MTETVPVIIFDENPLMNMQIMEIITLPNGEKTTVTLDSRIWKDSEGNFYVQKPEIDPTTGNTILDGEGNIIYDETKRTLLSSISGDSSSNILRGIITGKIEEFLGGHIYGSTESLVENIYPHLSSTLKKETDKPGKNIVNDLFKYFYQEFFSNTEFEVSGYSLIFLYPPDFSGFSRANDKIKESINNNNLEGATASFAYLPPDVAFYKYLRDYMMFAVEFTIPEQQVTTSEIQLANRQNIEFVSGFNTSGELTVRYIDNSDLKLYKFHSIWIAYMKMMMRGDLEPADSYYSSKEIDYMGSMYFLKFPPTMDIPNYIGKATGIFPKNLPVNELLGNRTDNQLLMYTINYFYSMYEGSVLSYYKSDTEGTIQMEDKFGMSVPKLESPNVIYDEFNQLIMSAYNTSKSQTNYSNTVDSILPGVPYVPVK